VWDGVSTRHCRQFQNTRGGQRALASEVWSITVRRARRLAQACDTSAPSKLAGLGLTARDILVRPVDDTSGEDVFRLFNTRSGDTVAVPSPPGVLSVARIPGGVVYGRSDEHGYVIAKDVFAAG